MSAYTRRGFHWTTSSYVNLSFLRAAWGVLTMNTSAHLTNRSKIFPASGDLRSSARLRLLRLANSNGYGTSEFGCGGIFCPIRHISPLGGSTLITSAPKSDKMTAALGPAMKLAKSTTFNPEKIFSLVIFFVFFDCSIGNHQRP